MTLRDIIEQDATTVFLQSGDFAEDVVYLPRLRSQDTREPQRSIKAVVVREQITQVDGDSGETVLPVFLVHVANDATTGISSSELDCGGDKIRLPVRDGMTPSDRAVMRLLTIDNGMLVLECH